MINMFCHPINSSILKNLCQVKQEKHMNKKKLNINLVQHLWLDLNQERIDQVILLNIGYPWKQLDHKKKFFSRMSLWKTWSDVWYKMVVEEGLTRAWPCWTMHWRRESESLDIKVLDVMDKDKCMLNPRNQLVMKNHISLSVNLYWIKI